jgi:hypothetical protein
MDNVQNCYSYIIRQSSQTYRSYQPFSLINQSEEVSFKKVWLIRPYVLNLEVRTWLKLQPQNRDTDRRLISSNTSLQILNLIYLIISNLVQF